MNALKILNVLLYKPSQAVYGRGFFSFIPGKANEGYRI